MATIRDNVVFLSGDIKDVKYVDGSSIITLGQPMEAKPSIKVEGGVATILFRGGRKKSAPVAQEFIRRSKTMYASQGGSGGAPKELNFAFSVDVTIDDGYTERLQLGQGSNGPRNNWWVGFSGLRVVGTSMRTTIGTAYDKLGSNIPEPFNHVHAFLGKLFSKDLFNAVNMFEVRR